MAHLYNIQPWQMRKLTPWEHDALVAQADAEREAIEKAQRG